VQSVYESYFPNDYDSIDTLDLLGNEGLYNIKCSKMQHFAVKNFEINPKFCYGKGYLANVFYFKQKLKLKY